MNIDNSSQPAVTLNNILEAYFPFLVPLTPASAHGPAPDFKSPKLSVSTETPLESATRR
jgi:hypothetical protein